ALALAAPPVAMAADVPCKLPEPGLSAEAVCQWWSNHSQDFVDNTMCCLPSQLKAQKKEDKALVHNARARDPKTPPAQRSQELARANELFKQRNDLLQKFQSCVNNIIHALNLQQQRGTDPAAAIGGACGCTVNDIANVGYRCCADLTASSYEVDLN